MNKEAKKSEILSGRIKFLQEIAAASQREVERCNELIENAQSQEELNFIKFSIFKVLETINK